MRQSLGDPDPFRMRYRALLSEIVGEIVRDSMNKKVAAAFIKQRAYDKISPEDQARFIELVETEIMNLHEGNIARYRLRPSEFQTWQNMWR